MSIFVGIGPDKSLLSMLSKMRSCIIVIEFGISPVNRLLKRFNVSRWLKFDSVDGSLVRFPMAVGRGPVRPFKERCRTLSRCSMPSSVGMEPARLVFARLRKERNERLPSREGEGGGRPPETRREPAVLASSVRREP